MMTGQGYGDVTRLFLSHNYYYNFVGLLLSCIFSSYLFLNLMSLLMCGRQTKQASIELFSTMDRCLIMSFVLAEIIYQRTNSYQLMVMPLVLTMVLCLWLWL